MKSKLKDNLLAAGVSAAIIAAVVLLNIVLYALTSLNSWYIVYSEKFDLTISGNTDALFEEARKSGKKVDVIFCMPEDELLVHATGKDVLNTAKQFEERYPDLINLKFYNVRTQENEEGEMVSDEFAKYVELYKKEMDEDLVLHKGSVIFSRRIFNEIGEELDPEFTVLNSVYGSTFFADFYNIDDEGYATAYNGEEVIASRVLWTLTSEHKTAYFTTGHGESVDLVFANILTSAGYYIKTLDLSKKDVNIDRDKAAFVIVSNPTADFQKGGGTVYTEIDKLESYLQDGGSLYVTLDPYVKNLSNLKAMLENYGIKMSSAKSSDGQTVSNIVKDSKNAITTDGYTFVANYADNALGEALGDKTDKYVSDSVIVKNVGALELSGDAKAVLVASSAAETVADGRQTDGKGGYCVAALSEKQFGSKTATVFVSSGVYMTTTDAVVSENYANRNFSYAVLELFFDASSAPYGCKLVPYDTGRLEDLTMGRAGVYTAIIMAVPVLLTIGGIAVNKRRKNR